MAADLDALRARHEGDDYLMELKNPYDPRPGIYDGSGSHFIASTADKKAPLGLTGHDVMHGFRMMAIDVLAMQFIREERISPLVGALPVEPPEPRIILGDTADNVAVIPPRATLTGTDG